MMPPLAALLLLVLSSTAASSPPPKCTATPQPCKEHGVTFCLSKDDNNQCSEPMPHRPCPPCPAPKPSLGAAFALASALGDDMVLQRAPGTARVWGFAPAGTTVTTTFKGRSYTSVADATMVWRQALPPQPASAVPTNLTFTASDGGNATLRNVVFGDVHLCSGQSNMEYTPRSFIPRKGCRMNNCTAEIAASTDYADAIRLFTVSAPPHRHVLFGARSLLTDSLGVGNDDRWSRAMATATRRSCWSLRRSS